MLGMSAPLIPKPTAEPAPAPAAAAAAPAVGAPAVGNPLKQTLLGVSPLAAQPAQPARAAGPEGPAKRTSFGVSGEASAGQPAGPSAAEPARSPAKALPAKTDRTMLGITPLAVPPAPAAPAESASSVWSRATSGERASAPQRSFTPVVDADGLSETMPGPPDGTLRWLWLAVGALTVLAIGGGILAWISTRGPELAVRVVSEAGNELLEVEAPGSAPDARLRFQGVERPLQAGRARFPLKADALKIGENKLAIDLLDKSGAVESSSVNLRVAYRVRVDTTGLSSAPPQVSVVVDAMPGSKVQLDGEQLPINEHGHGSRNIPVAPQAGGVFSFSARYRVEPPEEKPEDGKLELSLPVTSMQIDRPGPEVVTDQSSLEVAGAVEPSASIEVNGQAVAVNDGRFLHRAELGKVGDHVLKVVARAKGKAPRVVELKVSRVEDLTLAAASFTPDPQLTYARIAQKPVIYRGQKVTFDGRVYNVEVDAGRSVLQMLVLDCPGKSRCPLWVEYPQATEATIDSWVRVLGVIAGEQQFRSKQGQVQTVPSVHAQYVLKLAR